jgi:hypothetical protein
MPIRGLDEHRKYHQQYAKGYRSYPGGRPLARSMGPQGKREWAQRISGAFAEIPEPNKTQRLRRLCETLANLRGRENPYDRKYLERLVDGKDGAGPDTAFYVGEALYDAGVPWMSGLLSLAFAGEFLPHAIGCIARTLELGPTDELRDMWEPMILISQQNFRRPNTEDAYPDSMSDPDIKSKLVFDANGHRCLRYAWEMWWQTKENTAEMPDVFQQYLALCRIPIDNRDGLAVRVAVRGMIHRWMQRAYAEWHCYTGWFKREEDIDLSRTWEYIPLDALLEPLNYPLPID